MQSKFIGRFIVLREDGKRGNGPEISFVTLEAAQAAGEHLLPIATNELAPAKVIWMVREIAG